MEKYCQARKLNKEDAVDCITLWVRKTRHQTLTRNFTKYLLKILSLLDLVEICNKDIFKYPNNNNNNDRLTAFDPGQPG